MPQGVFSEKQTLKAWLGGCLLGSIIRFKISTKERKQDWAREKLRSKSGLKTTLVYPTKVKLACSKSLIMLDCSGWSCTLINGSLDVLLWEGYKHGQGNL